VSVEIAAAPGPEAITPDATAKLQPIAPAQEYRHRGPVDDQ